jgi:hypothetical protein
MKRISKSNLIIFGVFAFIIALLIGGLVYFYQRYQMIKNNPSIITKEEIKTVIEAISQFMELPTDEEPTIATVTDIQKLKDQEFFKKAQNGDKLLLYTKARKAILYRPTVKKIIDFSALTFGEQNQATSSPTVEQEPIKIVIYNGTKTAGLTAEIEKKLGNLTGMEILLKTNAAKTDYTKTMVIDLSGKYPNETSKIAQLVGGVVGEKIPESETKPQADILIIAGK